MKLRCRFSHRWGSGSTLSGRNADGQLCDVCADCLQPVHVVLQQEAITDGPASTPTKVLGQPTSKARVVKPARRIEFPRQSSR